MFFKKKEVVDYNPEIITLDETIKAVGISIDTNGKNANKDISKLGKEFAEIKGSIEHKEEPWRFVAVSKNYNITTGEYNYFMGDVVTSFDGQPENLETFEIPQKVYGKVTVKAKNRMSWGLEIIKVKKHFYLVWLPKSKFKPAKSIGEFEIHDERSRNKKPEMDMYFAIRKRK